MNNSVRTIIEDTGNANLGKLLMRLFRVIVRESGYIYRIPDECFDFDAFAYRVAQDRLFRQVMHAPERDICPLQTFGPQPPNQSALLWAPIAPRAGICS